MKKKIYWGLGIMFTLTLAFFAFLSWGNPQSSRIVYMWQAYVYPGAKSNIHRPPPGYTGDWNIWGRSGNLLLASEWVEGSKESWVVSFYESGEVHAANFYKDGPYGIHAIFFKDGDHTMIEWYGEDNWKNSFAESNKDFSERGRCTIFLEDRRSDGSRQELCADQRKHFEVEIARYEERLKKWLSEKEIR